MLATLPNDIKMIIKDTTPSGWIQRCWTHGYFYEDQMLEYIVSHYSGGTFIDIGASVGNHTVFFAKRCASHVISVEPVLNSYNHMMENVELNGMASRVTGINCALGSETCEGIMILPDGGNEGMWKFAKGLGSCSVSMTTLDSFDYEFCDVTLIKIDAEGYEAEILEGAKELIRQFRPVLFVEAASEEELREICKITTPLGYSIGKKFNETPTYEFKSVL